MPDTPLPAFEHRERTMLRHVDTTGTTWFVACVCGWNSDGHSEEYLADEVLQKHIDDAEATTDADLLRHKDFCLTEMGGSCNCGAVCHPEPEETTNA